MNNIDKFFSKRIKNRSYVVFNLSTEITFWARSDTMLAFHLCENYGSGLAEELCKLSLYLRVGQKTRFNNIEITYIGE